MELWKWCLDLVEFCGRGGDLGRELGELGEGVGCLDDGGEVAQGGRGW